MYIQNVLGHIILFPNYNDIKSMFYKTLYVDFQKNDF